MLFGTFFRHRLLEGNHLLGNLTRLDLVRRGRNIRRGWVAGRYRFVSNRFFGQILQSLSRARFFRQSLQSLSRVRRSNSGLDCEVGF